MSYGVWSSIPSHDLSHIPVPSCGCPAEAIASADAIAGADASASADDIAGADAIGSYGRFLR